jgi:hypothetical protein
LPVASVLGETRRLEDRRSLSSITHTTVRSDVLDAGIDQNLRRGRPSICRTAIAPSSGTRTVPADAETQTTAGSPDYERVWSQFAQLQALKQRLARHRPFSEMTENPDKILPAFRKVAPSKLVVSAHEKASATSRQIAAHFGFSQSEVPFRLAARRKQNCYHLSQHASH